jgi:hypothetical protein
MSLFGKYNRVIDELMHGLWSLFITLIAASLGLSMDKSVIIFFAGWLIDLDHLFNPFIAKKILKIKDFKGTITSSDQGYTIKVLHGFDIALIISLLAFWLQKDLMFSVGLFSVLSFHELWDFMVYPHNWQELFFVTRIAKKFHPGIRKKAVSIVFDNDSLKY